MPDAKRPRRLGRGLNSLIAPSQPVPIDLAPDHVPENPQNEGGVSLGLVRLIDTEVIRPSPFQPRREFNDESLSGLAESIRRSGLMQPIVVRPAPEGGYELIAGERRWRAAQRAGLTRVPASVQDLGDAEAAEWAVVENVQREDLNPIERGWAFRALAERFEMSHAEIGERVGLDRSSVANLIRLTDLEEPIQRLVAAGGLGMGHARAVLGLSPGEGRVRLARRAAEEQWTARKLEAAVRSAKRHADLAERPEAGPPTPAQRAAALGELEKQLGEHLGTKVAISTDGSGTRGRIIVRFYNLDHFDGLMSRFGFEIRS
ncbi:MAG: ParB/RepB/Spo0J family partition protein [Phycisphaerales bacterium]|nr:MAG: ParB/RepB/Spo0J family partition protein [Phycisphaerales bacterium]